jgi:hypothetical protein
LMLLRQIAGSFGWTCSRFYGLHLAIAGDARSQVLAIQLPHVVAGIDLSDPGKDAPQPRSRYCHTACDLCRGLCRLPAGVLRTRARGGLVAWGD